MRRASLLLEALISVAIFSVFVAAVGFAMILGERSTVAAGDRQRATFLAEQGIEAARYLRDADFDALTPDVFTPVIAPGGLWSLLPGEGTTPDGYRTSLTFTDLEDDRFVVSSRVAWDFGKTRSGSVLVTTYLTDWRRATEIGNWAQASLATTANPGGAPSFTAIAVTGTAAYITGFSTASGAGLYAYDIGNPASPVRLAATFDLDVPAYDVLADGTSLFLAVDDSGGEIRRYHVTHPSLLSPALLTGSFNLPGTVAAQTLAFFGGALFVGTADDPTGDELFALGLSETGSFILLDSLNVDGGITDIRLHDGYAYLSTTYDGGELQVVDVFDPEDLVFDPGRGMDLPDVYDGTAVAAFGTSALLGRSGGPAIDELILYSIAESPLPSPPPGPWVSEVGATVSALDSDPTGAYGFVGCSAAGGQFRVLSMPAFSAGADPRIAILDAGSPIVDLSYDWRSDRVYAVTAGSLLIFAPGP